MSDNPTHRGQRDFDQRQEAKIDRKEARAENLENEAVSRHRAASSIADIIPMGQPILVGHHSEKRHRRDLERIRSNTLKGIEADAQAKNLRAQLAHPSTAVSSDDPEAVTKLKVKLAGMVALRDKYKLTNKAMRKKSASAESVAAALEITVETAAQFFKANFAGETGIPSYKITNLTANIRRVRQRIEALAVEAAKPEAEPVQGDGWTITEDHDDNRVWVTFDTKPPRETTQMMRSHAFKWSPTRGAWVRQLNNAARYAAVQVAKELSR